ncbi:MAG: PRC-barrel domain-containing protein [bacterium]
MILNYSNIIGSKVVFFDDGRIVGEVEEIVIEADTMELAAIILKNPITPFSKTRIVANVDIIGIDRGVVAIKNDESITLLKDSPKVKEWIKQGFAGVKQKVITRKKALVGIVYDYTLNCDTFVINTFLTRNMFIEKIVPITSVVEYKKKLIIIRDEFDRMRIIPTQSIV